MVNHPATAPYGSWSSPITPETLTAGTPARDFPCRERDCLYWQEARPGENGRIAVVARTGDGQVRDILPYPLSARSKVHEYGGRSWLVVDGILYFVLQDDQRLYRLDPQQAAPEPQAITPDDDSLSYADLHLDRARQRILCVSEQDIAGAPEPRAAIVAIPLDASDPIQTLVQGADFYAYPRVSPDGSQLCWLSWNHPQMPWDGSELWCADIDNGGLPQSPQKIAGGPRESVFQPEWSPGGELHFVSDYSGWWNLYRHCQGGIEPLFPVEAEFATPLWGLGMSTYGFLDTSRLAALFSQNGDWHLGILDSTTGTMTPVATPWTHMQSLSCDRGEALFAAAAPDRNGAIVRLAPDLRLETVTGEGPPEHRNYLSKPEAISFPSTGDDMVYGFFYPPTNPDYRAPEGDKPPLIVVCHGGPTGATSTGLNYKIQYWTSRGFALLDVNYRGSTGYGRRYRQKLVGQWGIVDVADVAAGALHVTDEGMADPARVLIRGSSAGGYTVLAALTFTDVFSGGASLYGIGELEALARDTHKFESRYLDQLVGPYPRDREEYRRRSPVHHVDQLRCPVIFFQGLEDKVVPPAQAREMVAALRAREIPVASLVFPDEGHGFRKAANIKRALEAELYFYRRLFGLESAEELPDITIDNL